MSKEGTKALLPFLAFAMMSGLSLDGPKSHPEEPQSETSKQFYLKRAEERRERKKLKRMKEKSHEH